MVEINFTFAVFTISFVVFALLMKVFYFDKVALVINQREALIDANLKASQSTRQSMEDQLGLNTSKALLKSARETAQLELNKAMSEANTQRQALVESAKQKVGTEISMSLDQLNKEREEIARDIDKLVSEISTIMTDKLISEIKNSSQAKTLSV